MIADLTQFKRLAKAQLAPLVKRYSPKRIDLPMSLWGLSRNSLGVLQLQGIDLELLLDRHGSPLHIVNAQMLDRNIGDFLAIPEGCSSGAEVYFSYKTNPVRGVLQRIHARNVGAEVISAYELWLALTLGIEPSRIVYNGPGKSVDSLVEAIEKDIGLINLNSHEEIALVAGLAKRQGKRPRVGLRVVVPGGWSGQFGEPVLSGAAMRAYDEALGDENLRVVALHAHLGGEITTRLQTEAFVGSVLSFADELYRRTGAELEILDFGGSLACPTTPHLSRRDKQLNTTFQSDLLPRPPETVLTIREYVAAIVTAVERHYQKSGRKTPRIYLEPGRALSANTQMLLCRTMSVRKTNELAFAILDAGTNIAEPLRSEYHQLFTLRPHNGPYETYRLVGPICTPSDVLYHAWRLPRLRSGDGIAIMDSGAYFVPFSTSFSFPQPAIVMLDAGRETLLRRAETFADLTMRDCPAHQPS